MSRYCVFVVLFLCLAFSITTSAQENDAEYRDFKYYIETPEIPHKAMKDISHHLMEIRDALSRNNISTVPERDGCNLRWSIPCSFLFAPNDTVLKTRNVRKMDILKDILKYPTMYKVVVGVFTDDTGDEQYRTALTEARAQAVSDYLYSIAPSKEPNITVFAIPYGGYAEPNNSISNRGKNRRVEIHIVPETKMIEMARDGRLKK